MQARELNLISGDMLRNKDLGNLFNTVYILNLVFGRLLKELDIFIFVFKKSVSDHNSQNLRFMKQLSSSAHLLPLLLLSSFHFTFVRELFPLEYRFRVC